MLPAESVQELHPESESNDEESCSGSNSKTVNGFHLFRVYDYSLIQGNGPGSYISSDIFAVGGYDWAIQFYPDGSDPTDQSAFVSVFITLMSEVSDVRAFFKFTLLDQSGKGQHSHFDGDRPHTMEHEGFLLGYRHFIKKSDLEASDFIKDDCISIHCIIGVVRNHQQLPRKRTSDMGLDFKCLLDSEVGSDIEFKVGDETFKAHKLILAARSPVFSAQFHGLIGNPNVNLVPLHDIEPFIFKAMLLYIYLDRLPQVPELLESSDSLSPHASTYMVQHLLAAADRFSLDYLKELCIQKLCKDVSVDTVATTLSLAEQLRCPRLKTFCLKFVAANLKAVMNSEGCIYLRENCPSLLNEVLETIVVAMSGNLNVGTKRRLSSVCDIDSTQFNNRRPSRGDLQQGRGGLQQGRGGLQQGRGGLQQGRGGLQQGRGGMQQVIVGLQHGIGGLQQHGIGWLQQHGIGVLQQHGIGGLQQHGIGVLQQHGIGGLLQHGIGGLQQHGIGGLQQHGIGGLQQHGIGGMQQHGIGGLQQHGIGGLQQHGIGGLQQHGIGGLQQHGIGGLQQHGIGGLQQGLQQNGLGGLQQQGIGGQQQQGRGGRRGRGRGRQQRGRGGGR